MDLRSKHKVNASFSMSSMTDIIFLLLIFFMLTSRFVTFSGLPVNLPSSKASEIVMQKVTVTITEDLDYYINNEKIVRQNLEAELRNKLDGNPGTVVLNCDSEVPVERFVEAAGISAAMNLNVIVAAKPR